MIANGAGYEYPWLTETPTAPAEIVLPQFTPTPAVFATQEATAIEMATTSVPIISTAESTPTGQTASKPLLPICGAGLLPLAGVVLVRRWHG
jgi:hypothetical protein